jgi:hypothetical protein
MHASVLCSISQCCCSLRIYAAHQHSAGAVATSLLLLWLLQVTRGETDASAPPEKRRAGNERLAAAYGSNGRRPFRLLSVLGTDLGLTEGQEVHLRGTWDWESYAKSPQYGLGVKE